MDELNAMLAEMGMYIVRSVINPLGMKAEDTGEKNTKKKKRKNKKK
jgi:hypothetical protein